MPTYFKVICALKHMAGLKKGILGSCHIGKIANIMPSKRIAGRNSLRNNKIVLEN